MGGICTQPGKLSSGTDIWKHRFLRWDTYVFSGFVSHYLFIMLSVPMMSEMSWEIFPKLWSRKTSSSSSSTSSYFKNKIPVKLGLSSLDPPTLSSHHFCSPHDLKSDQMTLGRAISKVNIQPPFSLAAGHSSLSGSDPVEGLSRGKSRK